MAKKRTIGILAAIVTADATALRNEFKGVDNTIRRSTTGWQRQLKGGLKLGAGFFGMQAGLGSLISEIQHVIANVEKIPGINPVAVASIVEARTEFAQLRNRIDGAIASVISFGIEAGKAVGAGAAMLGGASGADVAAGLSRQETPDELAAGKDAQYWDKVEAARKRLVEANKKEAMASMSDAGQIAALREEAARYEQYAQSSSINSLQRVEAETTAAERSASANQKLAGLKKELATAEEKLGAASFGAGRAKTDDARAAEFLREKSMQLQIELGELYLLMREDGNNPDYLLAAVERTKELTEVNKHLEKVLDRQGKKFLQAGEDIAAGFEHAVFAGGNLREMVNGLIGDMARVAFRSAITDPLGKALGGGLKSIFGKVFGGFFAAGGRPPVGKMSVVGEAGPELFVPDTYGTVIPNHALGGKAGNTYYIDARGTDSSVVQRLASVLQQLAGPGVVEQRALGAVMDYRRRGASA